MGGPGSGKRPRIYPSDAVDKIRQLYESGMTVAEVQAEMGRGIKVYNVIHRLGIMRPAVKRDQRGDKNSYWRAGDAGYQALHVRVQVARGKPSVCEACGATEGRFEWANLTGDYFDPNDYQRMCVRCHRAFDAERRRATGMRTSQVRRSA